MADVGPSSFPGLWWCYKGQETMGNISEWLVSRVNSIVKISVKGVAQSSYTYIPADTNAVLPDTTFMKE